MCAHELHKYFTLSFLVAGFVVQELSNIRYYTVFVCQAFIIEKVLEFILLEKSIARAVFFPMAKRVSVFFGVNTPIDKVGDISRVAGQIHLLTFDHRKGLALRP